MRRPTLWSLARAEWDILYMAKGIWSSLLLLCKNIFPPLLILHMWRLPEMWSIVQKLMFWGTFHPELRSIDLNQSGTFKIGVKIDVPLPKQMITNVHKALESSLSASFSVTCYPICSLLVHMCICVRLD